MSETEHFLIHFDDSVINCSATAATPFEFMAMSLWIALTGVAFVNVCQ
jgi:hypothetical protein